MAQPFGTPFGDPADVYAVCDMTLHGDAILFRLQLASDQLDSTHALCVDGSYRLVSLSAGAEPLTVAVKTDPSRAVHQATAIPLGDWAIPPDGWNPADEQALFSAGQGSVARIAWRAPVVPDEAYGDSGQLFTWSLSGLRRWRNVAATGHGTRGRIDLALSTTGGVHTLSLYASDTLVAQGSRTGNGPVTLVEQSGSGLSGTVALIYSADFARGAAWLEPRWPARYEVRADGLLVASVNDDGISPVFSARITSLEPGTYDFTVQPIDDTGVAGLVTSPISVTLAGRPEPPANLAYLSGDASACVLSFTGSATTGASYRLYLQSIGGELMDLLTPAATAIAGATQITLPSLAGYPGTARVLLVAVLGGIEDGTGVFLDLEFAADGSYVEPRPGPVTVAAEWPAGRALTLDATYDPRSGKGVPTSARIYLVPEDGIVDWDTPTATATIGAADTSGLIALALTANATADGWYTYAVRLATQHGTLSPVPALQGPVWLGNAPCPAPDDLTGEAED